MIALEGEVLPPSRKPVARGSTFVVQPSPFQPGSVRTVVLPEGGTIADAVRLATAATKMSPRMQRYLSVELAGHTIDPKHWSRIRPKPGVSLYMRVNLKGGDGKDVLRTVLMIAIVVISSVFNPFAAGTLLSAAFQIGAVVAGSMLVNALIPPPQAKKDPWAFDQQAGNPYGSLTGIRNAYAPYAPIPRLMGSKRMYPMLAARPYTETQGKTQWLRMLLLVGYGRIDVSDIRIGQTPISAFPGCEVEIREGAPGDAPITLFTRQIRELGMQVRLPEGTPGAWVERETDAGTQEVSIDITFPFGLVAIDPDDGDQSNVTVKVDVQWSADGSTWVNADWIDPRGEWGTSQDGVLSATAKTRSVETRSGRFKVTGNAQGKYKVRLRNTRDPAFPSYVLDDVFWTVLRSVREDNPVNMEGLCLIALRLKATEQLNGVPDVINCLASAYHDVYDADAETWTPTLTRNPAWQATDLLRKRGQEVMLGADRIDLPAFVEWAAACETQAPNAQEKRWTCDTVLEGGSIDSALRLVMASGRAALANPNGKYSVVRDVEQTTPVTQITPRNSWGYRGAKAFVDIPHALRVTFFNPDKFDAPDEIVVYRDAYNEDGSGGKIAASKFETLDLPTCRSSTLAWREGRYHLAVLELRPEEHTVNQDFESLCCTNGSLVRFSHDAISIGIATARVVAINEVAGFIVSIVIDADVEMGGDLSYAVRVRHADLSSTVHPLVYAEGVSNTLIFATPVAVASGPAVDDIATFGEASIETAPMIVKRIERADNFNARLVMVDAQAGVWTADTGTIPPFQSYINRDVAQEANERPARPVLNVRSDENVMARLTDGTLTERVELYLDPYTSPTASAPTWEAQWRPDGGNGESWIPIGRGPTDTPIYLSGVTAGDVIHVRARVLSALRQIPSDWEYVFDHTVVGKTTPPDPPSDFVITATLDGVEVSFTASPSVDIWDYEIRTGGSSWNDATVLDEHCPGSPKTYLFPLSGVVTFRIKARDVTGLMSSEVTANSPAANTGSGSALTVTLTPADDFKSATTPGDITSDPFQTVVTGNVGALTYAWTQLSGDAGTINTTAADDTTITYTFAAPGTKAGLFQVLVRDGTTGQIATAAAFYQAEYTL